MAQRTRGKKANATRPRRDRRDRPARGPAEVAMPPEPDPLAEIAHALAEDQPATLLMLASSLIASATPSRPSPFEPEPDADGPTLDDLVTTFLDVDRIETRGLLVAIAALVDDEAIHRRIDRQPGSVLATAHPWLAGLRSAVASGVAFEMVHVLGDADDVVVGMRVAPDHDVAVTLFVDHNLGTVVTDVHVVPMSPAELVEEARAAAADSDVAVRPLEPADARARLEDAIRTGSMVYPPIESDAWPAARPLVEWVLRGLPTGGSTYRRPEWDDRDLAEVTDRFFASPVGAELDDPDHRGLLESLLWFGTDYGPGDPLRWSPESVEIVLVDWIPRKIVAEAEYLSQAPDLLRAWIRFCHRERGVPEPLTSATLEVVDELEPEYQSTIRSPRPQGPAALMAAVGMADDGGLIGPDAVEAFMMGRLGATVGGIAALDHVSTEPLPDEDFDTTSVPDDLRARVSEVLALVDRHNEELFGVEHRTACRRLLARLAARAPERLRRGRADTAAAATCWIVAKANGVFEEDMTAKEFAGHVGLGAGSISQRGKALLEGLGVDSRGYDLDLGEPALLTSARRAEIVAHRDRFREAAAALGR